jgi:glucokinase
MILAIDLGGTKIAAAVVRPTGEILGRAKVATPSDEVPEAMARTAGEALRAAGAGWSAIRSAGVIVPGIVFPDGAVWAPNVFGRDRFPLRPALEAALPVSVVFDSDRSGYVLGEQWMGVAKGLEDVVFLAVGTGIGAGILAGGRVLRGWGGVAGAVGWFALRPGHTDDDARLGCFETEAAGPALARRCGARSAEEAMAAAKAGDARALEAVARTGEWLGMGIANLISVLNPQMVVLGGGLMHAGDLLLEPVRSAVFRWAQPTAAAQARIELSRLGGDAGLLGAARLALSGGFGSVQK